MTKREPTTRIAIILPDRQIKMLRSMAQSQKRSFSSVLREAVERFTGAEDTVQLGGRFDARN